MPERRKRRPKHPISEETWKRLEERDMFVVDPKKRAELLRKLHSIDLYVYENSEEQADFFKNRKEKMAISREDLSEIENSANDNAGPVSVREAVAGIPDEILEDKKTFSIFSERVEVFVKYTHFAQVEIADELGVSPYFLVGMEDAPENYIIGKDGVKILMKTKVDSMDTFTSAAARLYWDRFSVIMFIITHLHDFTDEAQENAYYLLPVITLFSTPRGRSVRCLSR